MPTRLYSIFNPTQCWVALHGAVAANRAAGNGILTNDALIVAMMQHQGLTNLASEDADFDRVPGITRYAPA